MDLEEVMTFDAATAAEKPRAPVRPHKSENVRANIETIWPLVIFFIGSASALMLVLWPDYLPMVDGANHLARLHIMTAPPTSPLHEMYTVTWTLIPDLGLDVTYSILHNAISPEVTIRFCVLLSFVLMLGAVWTIQRAIYGRLSYSAAAAPIFLFGSPWHMGYINFLMGTSFALAALAVYVAAGRRLTPIVTVVLGVAGAVMLICHMAAFAGFALLLSGFHLSEELSAFRLPRLMPCLRKCILLGIVFAPGSALYLLCEKPHLTVGITYSIGKSRDAVAATLATGGVIDACIMIGGLVLFTLARRAGAVSVWDIGKPPLALFAATILALPNAIGTEVDVDSRLVILLALAFLSMTEIRPNLWSGRAVAMAACLLLLVAVRMTSIFVQEIWYDGTVAQFQAQTAAIPVGRNLLVSYDTKTRADCGIAEKDLRQPDLLTHLASFATIDRAAFVPLIFAEEGKQPITLKSPYAAFGAPSSVPVPMNILELALVAETGVHERLKVALERQDLPTYFLTWNATFDYLLMLHNGCARNPLPAILKPVGTGDSFAIYQIIKRD